MPLKDQIENIGRKMVEKQPNKNELAEFVQKPKTSALYFADDGVTPNNDRYPVVIYRSAISIRRKRFRFDTVIDQLFAQNGWGRSWRDTIYDFVHYHSQIHEALGVARGGATVELGGVKGKRLKLRRGDIVILPAGTGHRLIEASRDFLVVGAYPEEGRYDECTDTRGRPDAIKRIKKVKRAKSDPVYGKRGPLIDLWSSKPSKTR